ncbi:MAG: NAD-dependent deacylase [Aquificae bacterium]|nr:NAD-dependent deacylase [Aquificota bacterium]
MDPIRELAQRLVPLRDEVGFALSGAGLSAASGVPTFRGGKDGLWNKFDPRELATFEAFEEDPLRVWKWYLWRMWLIAKAAPNAAHYALVEMEKLFPRFWHITQNVDGLHRLAGQRRFLELHGNIWEGKCRYCGQHYKEHEFKVLFPLADREFLKNLSEEEFKKLVLEGLTEDKLPRCTVCGGIVGPGVVWFGEPLPEHVLARAFEVAENSKYCFSIGTSAVVYPAAYLPEVCKKRGGLLVEVNPEETPLTPLADYSFRASAAEVLPKLVEEIKKLL